MALTMKDKAALTTDRSEWTAELKAEFERERNNPNPLCRLTPAVGK